jgi:hypothetical protein
MRTTAIALTLLAVGLVILAVALAWKDRDRVNENEVAKFQEIKSYWRAKFPSAPFARSIHFANGPLDARRIHIAVPKDVDALYHCSFSKDFLTPMTNSPDGLDRMIAEDLLLLRNADGTRGESTVSHDGVTFVQCNSYLAIERQSRLRMWIRQFLP